MMYIRIIYWYIGETSGGTFQIPTALMYMWGRWWVAPVPLAGEQRAEQKTTRTANVPADPEDSHRDLVVNEPTMSRFCEGWPYLAVYITINLPNIKYMIMHISILRKLGISPSWLQMFSGQPAARLLAVCWLLTHNAGRTMEASPACCFSFLVSGCEIKPEESEFEIFWNDHVQVKYGKDHHPFLYPWPPLFGSQDDLQVTRCLFPGTNDAHHELRRL